MRLETEAVQGFDIRRAKIKANRLITPFLGREQQRAIAEADIEPAAAGNMAGDALDHPARHRALALHVVSDGLIGVDLFENQRRDLGTKIALRKDMAASPAFAPVHDRRQRWLIERVGRAIGAEHKRNIAAFAERTGRIIDALDPSRLRMPRRRSSGWRDSEGAGLAAVRPGLPHLRQRRLEMTRVGLNIEERRSPQIAK